MSDKVKDNLSILCTVNSCKYCDCENSCCVKKVIKVANCANACKKESTMCESYKER